MAVPTSDGNCASLRYGEERKLLEANGIDRSFKIAPHDVGQRFGPTIWTKKVRLTRELVRLSTLVLLGFEL